MTTATQPRLARPSFAAIACATLAALTLLALAVQPNARQADAVPSWTWPLAFEFNAAPNATLRWVLAIPRPPALPEETEDGPLLTLAPSRAARRPADSNTIDLRSYVLDAVRDDGALVPRLLLERLPTTLARLETGELRKRLFIKALLPALLAENERITELRIRLIDLMSATGAGHMLLGSELSWLGDLAESYGVELADLNELLRRVDAVPPSLALAQAALESGWGTSRSAQHSHSLFGHMMFTSGELGRAAVRPFESLADAITAYVHNLNTHRAYAQFRDRRARQRMAGQAPDGHELAGDLLRYSERGGDYIRDVRVLIRTNRLDPFDRARLGG